MDYLASLERELQRLDGQLKDDSVRDQERRAVLERSEHLRKVLYPSEPGKMRADATPIDLQEAYWEWQMASGEAPDFDLTTKDVEALKRKGASGPWRG